VFNDIEGMSAATEDADDRASSSLDFPQRGKKDF
jgi:hypothetical protein